MASLFGSIELPRSLVGRSLLASVSAFLLVMVLLGASIAAILAVQREPFLWEGPAIQAEQVTSAMRFDTRGRLVSIALSAGDAEAFDALPKDMAFQVLDGDGREICASPEGAALEALRRQPVNRTQALVRISNGTIPLQVMTTPILRGDRRYLLRSARSERLALGIRSNGSAIFYLAAVCTGLLAVLVFSTIALWMARRTVRPLKEASDAAAAIRPANLEQRVDARNLPSEVTPLVDAFNGALERLETGYRVQQEFLASVAHELKTPLSLMRGEIELGNIGNAEILLGDIDAMATQVQQLLELAEVSEIRNFRFEPLEIAHILEETVAYVARLGESRQVHLRLDIGESPRTQVADKGALSTLVKNLLENAVHHSPPGGVVVIRLSPECIAVIDEGPGVAPFDVPRLFSRFWRSESAPHRGAGLGLSISQTIAAAHGWKLDYRDAVPSPGAEFRVTFRI